jgi:hypothetical protein
MAVLIFKLAVYQKVDWTKELRPRQSYKTCAIVLVL